ncbi:MAG: hypothetical protein AAF518_15750 [Spirochaetota bacterium]
MLFIVPGIIFFRQATIDFLRVRFLRGLKNYMPEYPTENYYKIEGKALALNPINSPLKEKHCIYYDLSIQISRSHKGNETWNTIHNSTESDSFYVERQEETLLVIPDRKLRDPFHMYYQYWYANEPNSLPPSLQNFPEAQNSKSRFVYASLSENDNVLVAGWLGQNPESGSKQFEENPRFPLVVFKGNEEEYKTFSKQQSLKNLWLSLGAIGFGIIAFYFAAYPVLKKLLKRLFAQLL